MSSSDPSPTAPGDATSEEFRKKLAEYLKLIEREDSAGIDAFREQHPQFASRLGRQVNWLVEHLAHKKDELPTTIGPYRVQQRLGAGGMGEVYLAEQTTPFRRTVAVKIVKTAGDGEARLQRFTSEIQVLASLNHNGIAKLFEAGNDHGRPYFAMEYVPGKAITDYCAEERLDLDARLRLFVEVCGAVEYAHRLGVIHRDLKPQNVLVHGPRSAPIAKVIDFGLAKVVQPESAHDAHTRSAQFAGTPDYMSPEQVDDSDQRVIDTRADVYSLGVVLYELLTGVLPLSLWQLAKHDIQAMIRAIREQQPSSPSVRVETTPSSDSTSPSACGTLTPRRLSRLLAGDLDAIVMKALAKHADRRYGSVAQLADDIGRYLRHEPVSARPRSVRYVASKFVRRHRFGVAIAGVLGMLIIASLTTIYLLALQSVRRLEDGNLFGLAMYVEQLRVREAKPPAARVENLGELRKWLREFELVLAQRDRLQKFVDAPESNGADATDPEGWASGRYAQQVLRETLRNTLDTLAGMTQPGAELDKARLRIDWAGRVKTLTIDAHREAWDRVRNEVLAEWGIELRPQAGLVPLGRDEATKLQEFALPLPGADMPQRINGRWVVGERTCPVFVLLPGGDTWIGSQNTDEDQPRFDGERNRFEDDPKQVRVDAFFASKYEFTNGQWQLLDPGTMPHDRAHVVADPRHPVAAVNDVEMRRVLLGWGMRFPEVVEWEYLARGGTDGPRWCGDFAALQRNENLRDAALVVVTGAAGDGEAVPWDDGFQQTAPVGSFASTHPFLLFDVLGNVIEIATRPNDEGGHDLELRGGSWHEGAKVARATRRTAWDGSPRPSIGLRPVISVQR